MIPLEEDWLWLAEWTCRLYRLDPDFARETIAAAPLFFARLRLMSEDQIDLILASMRASILVDHQNGVAAED